MNVLLSKLPRVPGDLTPKEVCLVFQSKGREGKGGDGGRFSSGVKPIYIFYLFPPCPERANVAESSFWKGRLASMCGFLFFLCFHSTLSFLLFFNAFMSNSVHDS